VVRNKITIGLSLLALGVGALSLYEGWGRVSTIFYITAAALAIFRMAGGTKAIIGFDCVALTLVCTAALLEWTRGL
jgi:hypothetical protein